jgi:hypothetical protein
MMDRILPKPLFAAALFSSTFGISDPALARSRASPAEEQNIAFCIRAAAQGKSWLEKTLWGLRDQEGGWLGAAVLNTNGSHDLGPLQINSWWVPRIASLVGRPAAHVRVWLQTDACFNAAAARWIFLTALAESQNYWKAIGIYHSPTLWRQRSYAASVASKLRLRFGSKVFSLRQGGEVSPAFPPANERE